MDRTDRRYALVDLLRTCAPHPVCTRTLAERLAVTTRTIERDIAALQAAGIPIEAAPGRGGYLFVAAGSDGGSAGGGGLARVLLFRRRDEQLSRAVIRAVQEAVARRRLLVIDYADRGGTVTTREVEPAGLLRGADAWYLVGWCRLRGEGRAFRLDRIGAAVIRDEIVPAHAIRDLAPDVPAGFGALGLDA